MADRTSVSTTLATLGTSGWAITPVLVSDGPATPIYDAYRDAGERTEESTTGVDYISASAEWKAVTVQTNATGDVVVYAGPALVRQVRMRATTNAGLGTTAAAGAILVKDGAVVKDGAIITKAAGTIIYDGGDGAQFRTNVTLNFANLLDNPAADGKVEVLYRPMDAAVNW